MAGGADAFVLMCVAFILPPAAVAMVAGCGADLCLNILLTLLGYLPGCIHAFWLVLKRAEANERFGYGNWIYVGMGEYHPRGLVASIPISSGQVPPPPPPPPPPPGPPPLVATSRRQEHSVGKGADPFQGLAPADQKASSYYQAPQQEPPASQTSTAPPGGT